MGMIMSLFHYIKENHGTLMGFQFLSNLVQKSFARLVFNDFPNGASYIDQCVKEKLAPFSSITGDESYQNHDLEKSNFSELLCQDSKIFWLRFVYPQDSQQVAKPFYDAKVQPSTLTPKELGNMYTASFYAAFASLLYNKNTDMIKECNTLLIKIMLPLLMTIVRFEYLLN